MEWINALTVGEVLERGADLAPDKTAVVDDDERITYGDLNALAEALAVGFTEMGLKKGDRVAIYMKNSVPFMVAFYALQKLGIIVAWVNPLYRTSEAEFILKNSGARSVIVCDEWEGYDYVESIMTIKKNLPELETIIVVGDRVPEHAISFDSLIREAAEKKYEPPSIDNQNDLAMLIYTSGTTGLPKGAMITHYQSVRAGLQYSFGVSASSEDVFIGFLPMSHSYGCGAILIQPLLLLSTVVLMDKFVVEKAFNLIEKEKITLQLAAPAHYILELNHPKRSDYNLSSLRAGLIAGQISPEGLITRVEKEMGIYLTSFWGASEVGPGVGIMCPYPSPLDIRESYIGQPIADTDIEVVDPESHEELDDGEIGELTLSGWHVLKGYWNNPEETRKQIIDGRLFMGDLVSREEDNFFKVYGRTKDLINRGGYKIYPYELESLIIEHPAINEACVVATPNPVLGENICVCITLKEGQSIGLSDLRKFLKDSIAPHKLPNELCIMKEFPRLSGGVKLNKFGKGGVTELALQDDNREIYRK